MRRVLRHPLGPPLLIGWGIASAVLCAAYAGAIAHWWFPDPDDAMRLTQVRDWIAGQSWWNVGQHRLWGGAFAMHWSRLVDLPLAAVIVAATPPLGADHAATLAMVLVPLLTLGAVMALAALATRRLAGQEPATLAILLVPLSIPLIYQVSPLRIDHHGWQIALALAAATALVTRADRRSGSVAGVALAALLTISLEGLPITAALLGVALLAWVARPEQRRAQALALCLTLPAALLLLHLATRGPLMSQPACDAIAPAWIAALALATLGAAATVALAPRALPLRLAGLGLSGAVGVAALVALAPACLAGPFATLDPLVRTLWYEQVSEGRPLWEQAPAWAAMTLALPVVGLVGTTLAWRRDAARRVAWTMWGALLLAATLLALLVQRSGATANALAIPPAAALLHVMLTRARAIASVPRRTLATAGALLAASPGLAGAALFGLPATSGQVTPQVAAGRAACHRGREMASLAALPRATLFAPVDVTPALLAWTPHRAIGAGYHRNAPAIHRVFAGFLAPPDRARGIVLASGADYVVGCPGENETELYKATAPNGLWARLERGERVAWLEPVPTGNAALAWRVRR